MASSDGGRPVAENTPRVERDIGLAGAVAIGVGTMIAGGIFVLSGLAVANVGAAAVVSFVLAAIVAGFTAATYAEFATIYTVDGGGYEYVVEVFDGDWTFIVGWLIILGYPASAAFYLGSFSSWFYRFLYPVLDLPTATPYWVSGLVVLALIVAINLRGAEETGMFQVIVTGLKVLLIMFFLAGGFRGLDVDAFGSSLATNLPDLSGIALTSALVFITFFGFEAIATSEGEIEDPARTVPRAIFISLASVTVLYTLVVAVVVFAVNDPGFQSYLVERTGLESTANVQAFVATNGETAMGWAAEYYLGPFGFYAFIVGALLSMVSAANATVLAGSRVKLSMARHGHLPERFASINRRHSVPSASIWLTAGLILGFLLLFTIILGSAPGDSHANGLHLGLESMAHFADFMLLGGLAFVNAALIQSRRTQPDLTRQLRVPAVPWIPGVAIASNIALLASIELTSIGLGITAVVAGSVGYWLTSQ